MGKREYKAFIALRTRRKTSMLFKRKMWQSHILWHPPELSMVRAANRCIMDVGGLDRKPLYNMVTVIIFAHD